MDVENEQEVKKKEEEIPPKKAAAADKKSIKKWTTLYEAQQFHPDVRFHSNYKVEILWALCTAGTGSKYSSLSPFQLSHQSTAPHP